MLVYEPFLITSLAFGVIALIIFMASSILFMIPAMATRGTQQFMWFAGASLLLTIEIVVLVVLAVLVARGTIWS
jgi:hypothetical protein